jgi:hypothetical protein
MINSDHAVRKRGIWMTDLRLAGIWTATRNGAPACVVDRRKSTGPPAWRTGVLSSMGGARRYHSTA